MKLRILFLGLSFLLRSHAAELPVRHIVLYKHGVGYFERSGNVGPGDPVRLDFKASEMNDVLKSLSITETGGAKVSGIRYDSSIPLEQKLLEFPFRITDGQPLSAILDQLRGARIELELGAAKTAGIVVGARILSHEGPNSGPPREQITLFLDSGDLKTYDLAAAAGLRFTDPKLQAQFRDYLLATASSRSVEKRSLLIDSSASGTREIVASYIVPSPVWKSSYRLLLGAGAPSVLEGWAIVDNTTGEDWTGVRMSLVSGCPISFVSELYEPKYIARLTAALPEEQAAKPVVYQSALVTTGAREGGAGMGAGVGGGYAGGRLAPDRISGSAPVPQPAPPPRSRREPSSIEDQALAQERGDLFEYTIPTAVTVRKNESAMLPFLQDKIEARRLLVYSNEASIHPVQAAEIKNTSGKTLDGGPITVADAGAYAGEALIETTKANEKRLIGYAVDLGTTVTTAFDSSDNITREIHMNRGILESKIAASEIKTYSVKNADAKAKTLIIEHRKRPGYDLLSPKAPELTPSAYRFELALPASGSGKLAVSEEHIFSSTTALSSLSNDQIGLYLQNKNLSAAGRQGLTGILAAKAKIAGLDRQIHQADLHTSSLNDDAKRTRDNIAMLNGVSGQQTQVQTYATRLASLESEIAAASASRKSLQTQRDDAQAALESTIATLEF